MLKVKSSAMWRRLFRRGGAAGTPARGGLGLLRAGTGPVQEEDSLSAIATPAGVAQTLAPASDACLTVQAPRVAAPRTWYLHAKTALDRLLALAILLVTGPVILLAMLAVRLTSRGPAVYSQTRVGRDGRPFTIYKLRTMYHECESLTGACWSTPGDSRVTFVGRLLRASHLDELPQLWNVLRGEMSLVGPRPERPEFVPQLEMAVPHYRARLLLRPGLTGLAQVQLPPDTDLASVRLKLAYDIHYVQRAGLWLDLRLLAATAFKCLGVPFGVLRGLFRLTPRAVIERGYAALGPCVNGKAPHHGS
jgi:lipopolysaccharide/colanic/teichoic acid biosynthesis glycosyltransferase